MSGRLLLLDSASLYFRAYYGVPESITAPDGTPVNAVRGFTDMVVPADLRTASSGSSPVWTWTGGPRSG